MIKTCCGWHSADASKNELQRSFPAVRDSLLPLCAWFELPLRAEAEHQRARSADTSYVNWGLHFHQYKNHNGPLKNSAPPTLTKPYHCNWESKWPCVMCRVSGSGRVPPSWWGARRRSWRRSSCRWTTSGATRSSTKTRSAETPSQFVTFTWQQAAAITLTVICV